MWVELRVGVSGVTSGNSMKRMAGTTGLEPATSAVTVNRECVTYRNQEARMARFSSLRPPWERLLWTYCAHDLCPVDLCPIDAFTPPELSVMRGAILVYLSPVLMGFGIGF